MTVIFHHQEVGNMLNYLHQPFLLLPAAVIQELLGQDVKNLKYSQKGSTQDWWKTQLLAYNLLLQTQESAV